MQQDASLKSEKEEGGEKHDSGSGKLSIEFYASVLPIVTICILLLDLGPLIQYKSQNSL